MVWGNAGKKSKTDRDLYSDEVSKGDINGMLELVYKKMLPDYWGKYVEDPNKDKKDKTNILLLVHSMDLNFLQPFKTLLDINNLIAWNVHAVIIGSNHEDYYHNNRPYFNATSGTFEF